MCEFVEAVVDGYSPLNKHICKLARAGALLRSLPWWTDLTFATANGPRGDVRTRHGFRVLLTVTGTELPGSWHQQKNGGAREWAATSGEIPWR